MNKLKYSYCAFRVHYIQKSNNKAFVNREHLFKKSIGCIDSIHHQNRLLLTLLHSERPKLHTILAFLSAIGL